MQVAETLIVVAGMVVLYLRLKAQETLLAKSTDVLTQLVNVVGSYPEREIQYLQKQADRLQAEILAIKSPVAFTKIHGKPEEPKINWAGTAKFSSMGQAFEMPPEYEKPGA